MTKVGKSKFGRLAMQAFLLVMFFIVGMATSRLLYEGAFPRLLWLARPVPTIAVALLITAAGWACWTWVNRRYSHKSNQSRVTSLSVLIFAPLMLNLFYLFDPAVDPVKGYLIFAFSIWLTLLFLAWGLTQGRKWRWLGVLFILSALIPLYIISMPRSVGSADTFEFQVIIPQLGIAHPTGYPLYILLGRLFTFIPLGSMAWRVNLASVVFALLAVIIFYATERRLIRRPLAAVLATISLGLVPAFWSQAVVAEVYALHALLITSTLWLMVFLLDECIHERNFTIGLLNWRVNIGWQKAIIVLAFIIGLGMANHLTSLFLLPAAAATVILTYGSILRHNSFRDNTLLLLKVLAAFLLPLLLYAYLPVRWYALHGQSMGFDRFTQWVIGGRFQGALQLTAWLTDMTRYEIVGRLLLQNWGWVNLILIVAGLLYLVKLNRRAAFVLFITWVSFIIYALNYYVPDLSVFIIPAHVIMALFWGSGISAVLSGSAWTIEKIKRPSLNTPVFYATLLLLLLPSVLRIPTAWLEIKRSDNSDMLVWGRGVLNMPLAAEAAILADSEKIAPLYYLQQAEGIRPDLDIMVLPDEAAYRRELEQRIARGQSVYLARFLPGLESIYHLRSAGPLVEVSTQPMMKLPDGVEESQLSFGLLNLAGLSILEKSDVDPDAVSIILYWQSETPLQESHYIYLRWAGSDFTSAPLVKSGELPAGNTFPTVAWQPQEIVSDFHLLPRPLIDQEQQLDIQAAVGPSFTPEENLVWQTIKTISVPASTEQKLETALRAQNGHILLSGAEFDLDVRPQKPLPLTISGYGDKARELQLSLYPIDVEFSNSTNLDIPSPDKILRTPFSYGREVDTDLPNGRYYLFSQDGQSASICGWLAGKSKGCVLGEVNISGIALPDDATNFDDKIALLPVDLSEKLLQPGGQLPLELHWQSLAPINEDYTIFIQVLDEHDQIVGQVDVWPLQGTFPTSRWKPGEIVEDPHIVQLSPDMQPGQYHLQIGWYLLSTLGRLPVLDEEGLAQDDKLTIPDLVVP